MLRVLKVLLFLWNLYIFICLLINSTAASTEGLTTTTFGQTNTTSATNNYSTGKF